PRDARQPARARRVPTGRAARPAAHRAPCLVAQLAAELGVEGVQVGRAGGRALGQLVQFALEEETLVRQRSLDARGLALVRRAQTLERRPAAAGASRQLELDRDRDQVAERARRHGVEPLPREWLARA